MQDSLQPIYMQPLSSFVLFSLGFVSRESTLPSLSDLYVFLFFASGGKKNIEVSPKKRLIHTLPCNNFAEATKLHLRSRTRQPIKRIGEIFASLWSTCLLPFPLILPGDCTLLLATNNTSHLVTTAPTARDRPPVSRKLSLSEQLMPLAIAAAISTQRP